MREKMPPPEDPRIAATKIKAQADLQTEQMSLSLDKELAQLDAETTPLRNPEHYRYDFPLADVAEVWRRGSVVASWLLDLTAISLLEQPSL